jgi:hypothetical protein
MSLPSDPSAIPVRCECGKRYRVPAKLAGKEAACNACGAKIKIPAAGSDVFAADIFAAPFPTAAAPASVASKSKKSVKEVGSKPTVCGICQTGVEEGETCVTCASCGLTYHDECWQDNFGCATYGCAEVNALKPGPDLTIPAHSLPRSVPSMPGAPHGSPQAGSSTEAGPLDGIPVGHLLLGGSVLAMLLSCLFCGVPSLVTLVGAIAHLAMRPGVDVGPVIAAGVVSAFGFVCGAISTFFLLTAMG